MSIVNDPFFEFKSHLPENFRPTYSQFEHFAGHYVKSSGGRQDVDPATFDWASFKNAVDGQNPQELVVDTYINRNLPLQNDDASVPKMVDKVMQMLPSLLPENAVKLPKLKEQLEKTIHDLDGVLHGEEDPNSRSSTGVVADRHEFREYRALIGLGDEDSKEYLSSDLLTIKVNAHYKKETTWGGLGRPKITKELTAIVNRMHVLVAQPFTDPANAK